MIYRTNVQTNAKVEFQDITGQIEEILIRSNIKSGICHIFVPHTTAGITINEHADSDVVKDITNHLNTLVPQHGKYGHSEGNSPAHIKATLTGNSVAVPIENGKPVLGIWQGIFFCEYDGPRNRSLVVKIISD